MFAAVLAAFTGAHLEAVLHPISALPVNGTHQVTPGTRSGHVGRCDPRLSDGSDGTQDDVQWLLSEAVRFDKVQWPEHDPSGAASDDPTGLAHPVG